MFEKVFLKQIFLQREQENPKLKKVNQKDHNGSVCSVMGECNYI